MGAAAEGAGVVTCARLEMPGGGVAFVCGEDVRACAACGTIALYLCDAPMGDGRTCDAPLCERCAMPLPTPEVPPPPPAVTHLDAARAVRHATEESRLPPVLTQSEARERAKLQSKRRAPRWTVTRMPQRVESRTAAEVVADMHLCPQHFTILRAFACSPSASESASSTTGDSHDASAVLARDGGRAPS